MIVGLPALMILLPGCRRLGIALALHLLEHFPAALLGLLAFGMACVRVGGRSLLGKSRNGEAQRDRTMKNMRVGTAAI